MFKVIWNKELNGILLVDATNDDEGIKKVRPVFFEELDLLGFDKKYHWEYPKSEEPLLWASGREYYYQGIKVCEVNGGNLFDEPAINITPEGKNLKLKPINIKKLVKKNKRCLYILENEAMDFVGNTYKRFKNKIDVFAVSYSGGKDSQVVLDLVSRTLHPDDFIVIFSDTKNEVSFTYDAVDKTKEIYKKKYPNLKFYVAEPPKNTLEFWKEFGPPSIIYRWCCTVTKTAPFINTIRKICNEKFEGKNPIKILTFDGVRAEESNKRKMYSRLKEGAKHLSQTNAEVIKYWNSAEVYLYIFYRGLILNKGYRFGLSRIGCVVCPFASEWNEYIISKINKNLIDNYLKIIKDYVTKRGIRGDEIEVYIKQGQWKKRCGGEYLENKSAMTVISNNKHFEAVITKPKENFLEWAKTIGSVIYHQENDNIIKGEIYNGKDIFYFNIAKSNDKEIITIKGIEKDTSLRSKIERVLYKTTYCVHCGACKSECPFGALTDNKYIKIDTNLCQHCGSCLSFADKGCLVANSHSIKTYQNNKMEKNKFSGFGKYLRFGMREKWVVDYLNKLDKLDKWFSEDRDSGLGFKQIESMKHWLRDAELLLPTDKKRGISNVPTDLAKLLSEIRKKDSKIVWEIIWTNLYYNSSVCKWFVDNVERFEKLSHKDIVEIICKEINKEDLNISKRTIESGIDSLFNTFETTPLGKDLRVGLIEKIKKGRGRNIEKIGCEDIHPLVVAYTLYKAAEKTGIYDLTVSELYRKEFDGGPYKLFGILREKLEKILRSVQEDKEQILRVDLVANLDNIHLQKDLKSSEIIKIIKEKIK